MELPAGRTRSAANCERIRPRESWPGDVGEGVVSQAGGVGDHGRRGLTEGGWDQQALLALRAGASGAEPNGWAVTSARMEST